jgi:hypothetical protein
MLGKHKSHCIWPIVGRLHLEFSDCYLKFWVNCHVMFLELIARSIFILVMSDVKLVNVATMSSVTHLQTHEYSCRATKSWYTSAKRLIKWHHNMHIHLILRLILREKLPQFLRTFHVVVLKCMHQLKFVPCIWSPKLPVALNIFLEVSKFKFACKITFRVIRYFCSWFPLLP